MGLLLLGPPLLASSSENNEQRVFLTLTSQDFLWGSKERPNASFFEAENDFVRRSSGINEVGFEGFGGGGGKLLGLELDEKSDLIAAAAAAEAEEGRREEEGVLVED